MARNQLKWLTTAFIGTAKRLAGWDASGVAIEVATATQAEAITGTDDAKPLTPAGLESKRSVKSTPISNAVSGTTNIDCGLKQELKVYYNATVTGNITITKSNDSNLEILTLVIPVTGAGISITFPSDVRMARYNEVTTGDGWYESTKILKVTSVVAADLHEFSLMRHGSIFILHYDGPVRP